MLTEDQTTSSAASSGKNTTRRSSPGVSAISLVLDVVTAAAK